MSLCDRAEKYIAGAKDTLERVSRLPSTQEKPIARLLDAARRYVDDAEYYLRKGDCETALASVSYAEGLIDSLKYMGIAEFEWAKPRTRPKVFVAGTFEIIHPGHIELLKYAASLGEVHVVVARDSNVVRFKGRVPVIPENVRVEVVSSIKYVKTARLGDREDVLVPIGEIRPNIILLGPDQPFDEKELAGSVEARFGYRPKVIRYTEKKEFAGGLRSVSEIYSRICREYCDRGRRA